VKLLFDHNLSPRLVTRLSDIYPNSEHVYLIGFDRAEDYALWAYAAQNDYIIVTKDSDFNELSIIRGFPPKVIWLRHGNCKTDQIEAILRVHIKDIKMLSENTNFGILTLF
jgi:predicted nuclease of predicted toxin-antitoxin system